MAIDSPEKLSKAKELLQKAEMKLNSQLERPDYSDDLPEVQRLKSVINSARSQVNSFESSSRQVDPQTNRLTADAGTGEEVRVGDGNPLTTSYFYEPSLQSVRDRIESDPGLSARLGLPKFGKREKMVAQQAIQDAFQSQGMQPLPTVDTIDANSSAYKAVADDDWKRESERAKAEGRAAARYSKLKLKDNPGDVISGGATREIGGFLSSVAKSVPGVRTISRAIDEELLGSGRAPLQAADQLDQLSEQSEVGGTIGSVVGALRPGSVGNVVGNKVAKALNYGSRSPVGKAAIGGAAGALGSAAEGEAYALDEAIASEDENALDDFISKAGERATGNAIFGGVPGAAGDILSQAAKSGSQSLINFSPALKGLRELKNAGGDLRMPTGAAGVPIPGSAILSPVRVPDEIMQNFRDSSKEGEILSPLEIAANKVGPRIAESVDQQAQEAYRQAGESLEKYHQSPQGKAAKRVTKPARVMLEMIREGQNVGDLGTVGDAVPKIAKKLRERLMNEVERKEVSIDEYDRLKAQYGDDIIELDPNDADQILGVSKQEQVQSPVQPNVQPKTSATQVDDLEPEPVNPFDPPAKIQSPEAFADTQPPPSPEVVPAAPAPQIDKKLQPALEAFRSAGAPINKVELAEKLGIKNRPEWEVEQLEKAGLIRRVPNPPGGIHGVEGRFEIVQQQPEIPDVREAGTIPPKGKNKKAAGKVAGPAERDITPTNLYENSNKARNEYGEKMRPYREAMRASDMRTENLMNEFPYVENADPISVKPSELEVARTEFPDDSPFPKSEIEDISDAEEIVSLSPSEKKIAEDSFNNSYEEGIAVPNQGNYTPEYALEQIKKNGGVDGAARLNKGMRDMAKPMSAYKDAKTPQEATKIATSLEHPIEVAIDNGTTILRDGRHRLEAAKRNGATEIKSRVRVFRPDGKAEEVGVINLPIVSNKTQSSSGSKTVLIPRARNSRQIEKIQQDIAEDLQGISKDSDWLKKVDKAFRETRDQFEPNQFTPGEMTLDDGTKVTGLSALQRKHHELLQQIDEMKADTSSKSKTAILNKIKAFASGQNGTADKELLEQAKKLGLEKELRQVAATRVVPGLKTAGSPLENEKGVFTGLKNAGIQRALPILEAVGNVPGNPFIAAPNTPAARIQQYLFENSARNLLNFEGGRLGRLGNESKEFNERNK